ncbi:hypothetical protein N7520_004787 [Penicillium odoratum]|uniref:uncharacterized protein n=1 Tax=Penicillium odoratum TaxID=1167516 RepID=UPI002547E65C|nr:uncharacterized protein N7520_004787 [Penicillium odoratum]KAJ5765228.1 hypothetical protein N7520_004787 [Penicillium odoratum]
MNSSDIPKIKANLELGFAGVKAQGTGAYNTEDLRKMANTHVLVAYRGANIPKPDDKNWDMDRMFEVASKFESYVDEGREAVAVVLEKYLAVPDFMRLNNFSELRMDTSQAANRTYAMLDDLVALQDLKNNLDNLITKASNEQVQLQLSAMDGAYEANLNGLQVALADVKIAISAILDNASMMENDPQMFEKSASPLRTYTAATIIKDKLPRAKPHLE